MFCSLSGSVPPAAGRNHPPKPPASPSASNKPSWEVKQMAGATVLIRPNQEMSEGGWKVMTTIPFSDWSAFLTLHGYYISSCVCLLFQMTPVHHGTEVLGKLASQGSWGSPLKRRLQLGSRLGCGLTTVQLHRQTGWVSVFYICNSVKIHSDDLGSILLPYI